MNVLYSYIKKKGKVVIMARKEYDTLIRHLAEATGLDFYYVEKMLKKLVEDVMEEKLRQDNKTA